MPKLESKYFSLLSLTFAGVIFSGFFLICFNPEVIHYATSGKIIPTFLRNKIIITKIEDEQLESTRFQQDKFRANFEKSIRSFGLPFSAKRAGSYLKDKLGLGDLRIYDESYRLIYSGVYDKEVFNKELRLSNNPILPGTFSKLGNFEVYRSLDGLYFFRFSNISDLKIIKKLDIPFDSKYWVLDKIENSVKFTNDPGILSGAVNQTDYLFHIQKENFDLEKFSTDKFEILYTKEIHPFQEINKGVLFFLAGILTFVGFAYFVIYNYLEWRKIEEDEALIHKASEKMKLIEIYEKIEKKLTRKFSKNVE